MTHSVCLTMMVRDESAVITERGAGESGKDGSGMTDSEGLLASLPPPWNTDVVEVAVEVNNDCERVDYWDGRPQPPTRWVDAEEDEDSDGNWYVIREGRKKTLAEFKAEVVEYRAALAAWEERRAKGQPIQMRSYVPSGPPTITVRVTRKDGSQATIVGDGENWKVIEVRYGQ